MEPRIGYAKTSDGGRFDERGKRELKGVSDAVRVWAVIQGETL